MNSGTYTFEEPTEPEPKVYHIKLDERDAWYYAKAYIEGKPMLMIAPGFFKFLKDEDEQALNCFRGYPIGTHRIGIAYQSIATEISEPAPTVSLYNLLDHSRNDLDILHGMVSHYLSIHIEPKKESAPAHYKSAMAWVRIIETAIKEREQRDSEAWAEKTAKEIKETDNQFQAQQDSGGTL